MNFRKATTLAFVAAAGLSLCADDVTANLRGGWGQQRKEGVKDSLGFGLGYNFELSKDATIVTELSYFYQTGRGENREIPANSLGAHVDPNGTSYDGTSTNFQKPTNTGIGIRGLYRARLNDNWFWQGGLFVGRVKSRLEAIGDMRTLGTPPIPGPLVQGAPVGGWTITPERTSTSISPIVGLVYSMGEVGTIEFNAISLRYDQTTLTPTEIPGNTGIQQIQPVIGTKSVNHLNLEIGVSFRF